MSQWKFLLDPSSNWNQVHCGQMSLTKVRAEACWPLAQRRWKISPGSGGAGTRTACSVGKVPTRRSGSPLGEPSVWSQNPGEGLKSPCPELHLVNSWASVLDTPCPQLCRNLSFLRNDLPALNPRRSLSIKIYIVGMVAKDGGETIICVRHRSNLMVMVSILGRGLECVLPLVTLTLFSSLGTPTPRCWQGDPDREVNSTSDWTKCRLFPGGGVGNRPFSLAGLLGRSCVLCGS